MAKRIGVKVYVDVGAEFSDEGELIPKYVIWEDGTRYDIDRVKCHERCASRRAGGAGIMYVCLVNGQEIHLYYEENYKWFVEANDSVFCRSPRCFVTEKVNGLQGKVSAT